MRSCISQAWSECVTSESSKSNNSSNGSPQFFPGIRELNTVKTEIANFQHHEEDALSRFKFGIRPVRSLLRTVFPWTKAYGSLDTRAFQFSFSELDFPRAKLPTLWQQPHLR
jgi:hypothetical protein